ncbi:MAG: hypothetical protein FWH03_00025 [Firmicutes bacterium]|nr:hypothetical protein [Bacillota bacterium]
MSNKFNYKVEVKENGVWDELAQVDNASKTRLPWARPFMKLFRMAASVYTGATDGISFIKNTLLNKMERRTDFIQKFLEAQKCKKTDQTE